MNRKIKVFTPLYYSNGSPHVGHEFTTSYAALHSMHILHANTKGVDTKIDFITGNDEHGIKVFNSCGGVQYKEFIKNKRGEFSKIIPEIVKNKHCNIINHYTDSEKHISYVNQIYRLLKDKGIIYAGKYNGLYCKREEKYVTQKDYSFMSEQDKKFVITKSEEGYYLKITDEARKNVLEWAKSNVEPYYVNEATQIISEYNDIFISRLGREEYLAPIENENSSFYVWFDAILYYTMYMDKHDSVKDNRIIIGHDILKFHAGLLPILCYYIYGRVPFTLLVHGIINFKGKKVSKSYNNFQEIDAIKSCNKMFFESIYSNSTGEILVTHDTAERYRTTVANNYRNLYMRINALVNGKFKNYEMKEVNVCDSESLNKLLYGCTALIGGSKTHYDALELVNLANNYIANNKIWTWGEDMTFSIIVLAHCSHLIMGYDAHHTLDKNFYDYFESLNDGITTMFDIKGQYMGGLNGKKLGEVCYKLKEDIIKL